MAGRLDDCMITLIQVFAEYASKDEDKGGDPNTLSKGELKELIQNELKSIVNKADTSKAEKIFQDLENDQDGVIDFLKYMNTITFLTTSFTSFLSLGVWE